MRDSCQDCRFWHATTSECRRHAPIDRKNPPNATIFPDAVWPTTTRADWCGDFDQFKP